MLIITLVILLAVYTCTSTATWTCNASSKPITQQMPVCSEETRELETLPGECKEDEHCAFINAEDDSTFGLKCDTTIGKCICKLAKKSIHHVRFVNGQCLMSKYGPCNATDKDTNTITVGCLDGFECIENQCRDPNATTGAAISPEKPFQFDVPCNDSCKFAENLLFMCKKVLKDVDTRKCICNVRSMATDVGNTNIWNLYNYAGMTNCSVGRFGPCGERANGLKVDCYGEGLECINGRCMDPMKLISNKCEICQLRKDCAEGLICSHRKCITPKSVGKNLPCSQDEDCVDKLRCNFEGFTGGLCKQY